MKHLIDILDKHLEATNVQTYAAALGAMKELEQETIAKCKSHLVNKYAIELNNVLKSINDEREI